MSENIWKLGPAFRGPEDLAHLWIDLGAEPLYEISAGKTVYARHRIVEFFIGPGNTEAERASRRTRESVEDLQESEAIFAEF